MRAETTAAPSRAPGVESIDVLSAAFKAGVREAVNRIDVPFHLIHVLEKVPEKWGRGGFGALKRPLRAKQRFGVAGDVHDSRSRGSGARRTGAGLGGLRRAEKRTFARWSVVKIGDCYHRPSVNGQSGSAESIDTFCWTNDHAATFWTQGCWPLGCPDTAAICTTCPVKHDRCGEVHGGEQEVWL